MDLDDEGFADEEDGDGGARGHVIVASRGLSRPQRPGLGTFRMKHCSLSAFAVNVYMLSLLCSLSSTITTRHWAPEEKLPSLSVRGKLLSTANTGFKSNRVVTAQKKQSRNSASGPLVFPQLCEKEEEVVVVVAERADNGYI